MALSPPARSEFSRYGWRRVLDLVHLPCAQNLIAREMPKKKPLVRNGSFVAFELDDLERQVRFRMRRFQGPAPCPAELRGAISSLLLCRDVPELVVGQSPAAEHERLEVVRFLTRFPEFAVVALRLVFPKPQAMISKSAAIREFLLSNGSVELPDGKRIGAVGAADGEIAMAVEAEYSARLKPRSKKAGGEKDADVTKQIVKEERRRLERKYGVPIASLVEFELRVTAALELLYPRRHRARVRRERRAEGLASFYKPYG